MDTPAPKFTHKEHTIVCMPSGKFVCVVEGKTWTAASLDSMKKKLDARVPFVPFTALVEIWGSTESVQVVDVKKGGRRYGPPKVFVLKNGREVADVIEDTPHNRELIKKRKALRADGAKRKAAEDAATNKIDEALTRRKPE